MKQTLYAIRDKESEGLFLSWIAYFGDDKESETVYEFDSITYAKFFENRYEAEMYLLAWGEQDNKELIITAVETSWGCENK